MRSAAAGTARDRIRCMLTKSGTPHELARVQRPPAGVVDHYRRPIADWPPPRGSVRAPRRENLLSRRVATHGAMTPEYSGLVPRGLPAPGGSCPEYQIATVRGFRRAWAHARHPWGGSAGFGVSSSGSEGRSRLVRLPGRGCARRPAGPGTRKDLPYSRPCCGMLGSNVVDRGSRIRSEPGPDPSAPRSHAPCDVAGRPTVGAQHHAVSVARRARTRRKGSQGREQLSASPLGGRHRGRHEAPSHRLTVDEHERAVRRATSSRRRSATTAGSPTHARCIADVGVGRNHCSSTIARQIVGVERGPCRLGEVVGDEM